MAGQFRLQPRRFSDGKGVERIGRREDHPVRDLHACGVRRRLPFVASFFRFPLAGAAW